MSCPGRNPVPREYPDRPFVGVGIIVWKGEQVLLISRGKPPRVNGWSIPGGAQELGETLAEAACRELLEETGITVTLGPVVEVVDSITRDEAGRVRFHYTLVDFVAEWVAGEPTPGGDCAGCAWVPLSDLAGHSMWAETRRVIHRAHSLRGHGGPAPLSVPRPS